MPTITYSPSRSDNDVHHLVLRQESDGLAHPRRHHIGRVREENLGLGIRSHFGIFQVFVLVWLHRPVAQPPLQHPVYLVHRLSEVRCLHVSRCDERVVVANVRNEWMMTAMVHGNADGFGEYSLSVRAIYCWD